MARAFHLLVPGTFLGLTECQESTYRRAMPRNSIYLKEPNGKKGIYRG